MTGIAILALGIWTKVDLYKYMELSSIYYKDSPWILIAVGALIVIVGSFGCCCTFKGNVVLLYLVINPFSINRWKIKTIEIKLYMTEIFFFSNFNTFINKFNTYLKDFCCYKQNVHGIRIDILSIATRINFINLLWVSGVRIIMWM